ncbi:MAG: amino acid transporter, partial [Acidobacteriota bacterium]
AIAAFLLNVRDTTGQIPHAYFGWTEGNPATYVLKFIFFGEGDTAPMTREVLRQAEPEPSRRPAIHVGG